MSKTSLAWYERIKNPLDFPAKLFFWALGTVEGLVRGFIQGLKPKEDPNALKEYTVTYINYSDQKRIARVMAPYGFEATDIVRTFEDCKEVLLTWRPGMNDK